MARAHIITFKCLVNISVQDFRIYGPPGASKRVRSIAEQGGDSESSWGNDMLGSKAEHAGCWQVGGVFLVLLALKVVGWRCGMAWTWVGRLGWRWADWLEGSW